MIDKIRAYLDHEFESAPKTRKVQELKDELFINLTEKYNDMVINQGITEAEAYSAVIAGMGDVSELISSIQDPEPLQPATYQERRRRALLVSSAVMLYILSPFMLIFLEELFGRSDTPFVGILVMFFMIAVATGLLIYNHMMRPTYLKKEDTLVEEFKEWRVSSESQRAAIKSFTGAYWLLVVTVYLLVSFIFFNWAYSWLIFIVAAAIENIIKAVIHLGRK